MQIFEALEALGSSNIDRYHNQPNFFFQIVVVNYSLTDMVPLAFLVALAQKIQHICKVFA